MGLLNKLGQAIGAHAVKESDRALPSGRHSSKGNGGVAATGTHREPKMPELTRGSNGLKEFLWNLDGLGRGTLLDLGPAWQTTLSFFIERGFRVSSEDILRGWKEFAAEEDAKFREAAGRAQELPDNSPVARAARFLEANLRYPNSSFDAILLWDLLHYFDPAVSRQIVGCLTELLRPAGVIFAMFHSKKPEGFCRYRIADSNTLQVLTSPILLPA